MEAPIAALAVARMIASAATSTRSEREIASVVFLVMEIWTRSALGFAGVYLACSNSRLLLRAPSRHSIRICYFDSGCFDSASSFKSSECSQSAVDGLCPPKNESSNKFFQ
jgi:hypothetical protein